ncbi:hypothetical protein EDD18DRAFT_366591 [Armillaria luteobubalina]|uniref:Uncharacterized protein n=1 Tax=Armillaria luteobubalina TaxID=153913 RepID=A0AA39Q1C8_9AGAR|nr:hypothetical protein EDD18DRAFT_366591 [Armillaria luteobubalina]
MSKRFSRVVTQASCSWRGLVPTQPAWSIEAWGGSSNCHVRCSILIKDQDILDSSQFPTLPLLTQLTMCITERCSFCKKVIQLSSECACSTKCSLMLKERYCSSCPPSSTSLGTAAATTTKSSGASKRTRPAGGNTTTYVQLRVRPNNNDMSRKMKYITQRSQSQGILCRSVRTNRFIDKRNHFFNDGKPCPLMPFVRERLGEKNNA